MPKKKILIIDDEKDLAGAVKIWLDAANYETTVALSGQDGLAKSQLIRHDLILLDIKMPDMDGFQVLRRLRADVNTQDTPVIMLTCQTDSSSIFEAQRHGSVDYIIKQSDPKELLKTIKEHI